MRDVSILTTEELIRAAVHQFRAPRKQKLISTPGSTLRVHEGGEMMLYLPNGQVVKVSTDASGKATQIEEDEKLHAVARPEPISLAVRRQS